MYKVIFGGKNMNNKNKVSKNAVFYGIVLFITVSLCVLLHESVLNFFIDTAIYSAKSFLPTAYDNTKSYLSKASEEQCSEETTTTTASSQTTEKKTTAKATTKAVTEVLSTQSFTETPKDILELIDEAEKAADKDKKDGSISEKTYTTEGMTDSFSLIKVKNTNKTQIDIESILKEKIDLSVDKDKPAVLIFHSHTTETYQILDRDFYATSFLSRSNDNNVNMARVGKAICEEIEAMGYKVIHDTVIHDSTYSTAYSHSKKTVEEYLEKYPSIQIVLDIHRDAIQLNDGTKIKPTATVNGKKSAQIMIISGCQESGNSIENFPDWEYNLTFGIHLQYKLEELFPGITRPLYFCPRKYNMNLTHCSVLVEIGSDANTLEEAVYTGKCLGKAVAEILKEYEE